MKIVILDGELVNPGDLSWAPITALGETRIYGYTEPEQLVSCIGDAEAIFVNRPQIRAETLTSCKGLRYIGLFSTGYNQVDIQAARECGVTVCNVPAYSTMAVAQFTFAHLLALVHPVERHAEIVRSGAWTQREWGAWMGPMQELAGKTMGLVGYGGIGRAVAKMAAAFGMQVLATSPSHRAGRDDQGTRFVPLETLLAESDVVSLHCPLLPETRAMIGRAQFDRMKDGVIFLNTARGALVDEQALAAALKSGKVRAAGLDVLRREPPEGPDAPLLRAENCNVTPHIAWAPQETRRRLIRLAAENLRCFQQGKLQNVVNL